MTPAEVDALDREMRDMRKRLDKLETLVEKLTRPDVMPLQPHLTVQVIDYDTNIFGDRRGI